MLWFVPQKTVAKGFSLQNFGLGLNVCLTVQQGRVPFNALIFLVINLSYLTGNRVSRTTSADR